MYDGTLKACIMEGDNSCYPAYKRSVSFSKTNVNINSSTGLMKLLQKMFESYCLSKVISEVKEIKFVIIVTYHYCYLSLPHSVCNLCFFSAKYFIRNFSRTDYTDVFDKLTFWSNILKMDKRNWTHSTRTCV